MSTHKNKDMSLKIAMYPWLALGHITPCLHLANKLANKGHHISIFVPTKTLLKLIPQNNYPHLITLIPITIPHVDGLPLGAETTNDVPASLRFKLVDAMDLTRDTIDSHLARVKPNIVFLDTTEWLPNMARKHGAKSVYFAAQSMGSIAYMTFKSRGLPMEHVFTESDLLEPPPGYPSSDIIRLYPYESRAIVNILMRKTSSGVTFLRKNTLTVEECDAIMFKTCKEIEGVYCDLIEKEFGKPILFAGPVVPEPPCTKLDPHFDGWLSGFSHATVIYCARGSECNLEKDQFDDLLLGLELTGMPFLAALQAPVGFETVESALPEGFAERSKGRAMVYGGWVQQQLILQHPSVGCFVTHCGPGSLSEAFISQSQLVLIPQAVDHFLNARVMGSVLKVGVEVHRRGHDGYISKEAINEAVSLVMDPHSEIGQLVRANHDKWRSFYTRDGLEEAYIDSLIHDVQELLR